MDEQVSGTTIPENQSQPPRVEPDAPPERHPVVPEPEALIDKIADRLAARLRIVEEHIQHENNRDLEGILSTFGEEPVYEEQPWGESHGGLSRVRGYYEALVSALPDLTIRAEKRHVTEEAIILEVTITGTHGGPWRGLPATGRRIEFPLCAIYTFTPDDKLAGERIYYDRATVFRQLGLYHEPTTRLGQLTTALAHPLTLTRAYARQLVGRVRR